jgi:hypothetical protein
VTDSQAFAVDLIDTATWASMRRLAAAGVMRFGAEAPLLHRSAAAVDGPNTGRASDGRVETLLGEAAARSGWRGC